MAPLLVARCRMFSYRRGRGYSYGRPCCRYIQTPGSTKGSVALVSRTPKTTAYARGFGLCRQWLLHTQPLWYCLGTHLHNSLYSTALLCGGVATMVHPADDSGGDNHMLLAHLSRLPLPARYTPRCTCRCGRCDGGSGDIRVWQKIARIESRIMKDALEIALAHLFIFCE